MTTNLFDRVVQWHLDFDGDLYGDERERLRWYEGIATASSLQSMLIPWAAAIMVWPLGKPAVLPLAVVLVLQWVTMLVGTVYVTRRKVDTTPRSWTAKRLTVTVLMAGPFLVFMVGALYVFDPAGDTWRGAAVGGVLGGALSIVAMVLKIRRRDRLEVLAVDED
ncbi:hypothetical protein [Actinoplanes sp. NPDC026619]|uniref:hypothetical protein n=1 Tax=Actinoplanes sp. NPDC026619 TaxID=3155798 RepID=UPI0033F5BA2F